MNSIGRFWALSEDVRNDVMEGVDREVSLERFKNEYGLDFEDVF